MNLPAKPTDRPTAPSANMGTDCSSRVQKLVRYFETLTPESLQQLNAFYAADAYFKDPFNEVHSAEAIVLIFTHMFASLQNPHFKVTNQLVQDSQCFLTWEFHFRFKSFASDKNQIIYGASHLHFTDQGLVTSHRDYWDAAEELYEKIPLLGGLMRFIKKREKLARDSFTKAGALH